MPSPDGWATRRSLVALSLLALVLGVLLGGAATPLRLEAVVPLPMGIPRELAVSADGSTAFVANDEGWNVVAVDLADPLHPRLAGVGSTGGFASSVVLQGDQVLASDSRHAVHALRFRPGADPFRTLVPLGARPFPKPRRLLQVGNLLLVAGPQGVALGDRLLPELAEPLAAWSSGGKVYLGGQQEERWVVLDVTSRPRKVASLPGGVTAADSDGRLLCLARGPAVEVLDASSGEPRPLRALEAPSPVLRVRVRGDRAVLSGGTLAVVDLARGKVLATALARPNAGTYGARLPAFVDALPCRGGFVAALDRFWGLRVLRGDTLEEVADLPTSGGDFTGMQVDGERLYVGNNWGGVAILDLSDPDHPKPLGGTRRALAPNPGCAGFLARGSRLWSQGNEDRTLRAFDVLHPEAPGLLAQVSVGGVKPAGDVRRFGAGYPAFWQDLLVLPGFCRVVRAETLERVGQEPQAGYLHDAAAVAVVKGVPYAVLTGEEALEVVDLRDPARPRQVGRLPGDYGAYYFARGLEVVGSLALVANRQELRLVDLSEPSRPALLSALRLEGEPVDVRVVDGLAFVAACYGGLHVVDVRDPRHPRRIERFSQVASAEQSGNQPCYQAVEVARGRVYVADYYSGVQVLRR